MTNPPFRSDFFAAFARPVWIVMMVAQMLLGLVFAIALVMKYYMLVFGVSGCVDADPSIANAIRCTPSLIIAAHFLIAMAAVRLAAFMFIDDLLAVIAPVMIGLLGLFLLFMSGVGVGDVSWALAAVILVFLVTVLAAVAGHHYLSQNRSGS